MVLPDDLATKALGGLLARAWESIRTVFRRAKVVRAAVIGELEASEAVNAAIVEAAAYATRRRRTRPRKVWLTDSRPCEICQGNHAAGPIALGEAFPSGHGWAPGHPKCRCAVGIVDVEDD